MLRSDSSSVASILKQLRHFLSKKYTYTIVADRGFGNDRVAVLCLKNGFDYVLRKCNNLNIEVDGNRLNLKDFPGKTQKLKAYVSAWEKEVTFEVKTKNDSI
ncbi:hypothetical protein FACS189472_05110 [Alphaproteobacteria bacterium]|nr:hypothetical protein FACS189472_05110 [Alphaproteobacteria bacterium]